MPVLMHVSNVLQRRGVHLTTNTVEINKTDVNIIHTRQIVEQDVSRSSYNTLYIY